MEKKDLNNGAVVQTMNGNWYIKINRTLINLKEGTTLKLSDYYDNLKAKDYSDFTIVKVYNSDSAMFEYLNNMDTFIKIK